MLEMVPPVPEEEIPEEEVPEKVLTASERFNALPRFGASIFAPPQPVVEEVEAPVEGEASKPVQPSQPRVARVVREVPAELLRPASVSGEPAAAEAVPPSYIIGPGDELVVRVWTDAIEHVKANPVVDAEGAVYLDLLGEVTVAGESLGEVRQQMTQRYRMFFTRAQVSVGLARTRVIEVRVTGDALYPGRYRLTGTATLFSALYAAGGPNEIGSLRTIKLLRQGEEPLVVDLYRYLLEGDISGDVPLQPDDTIFIAPAGPTIGVDGEVRRPARYELASTTTLAEALQMAAGVSATGYAHNVEIWRVGESGRRELVNVDARAECTMPVQDGDLIVVTPVLEEPRNVVELSGAVERPGIYEVHAGMRISDLLSIAQGLSDLAHTEEAALWRLGDDLDYDLIAFDLAAALAGDPAHDLVLQPRDKVVVLSEEEVEAPMEVEVRGAVNAPGSVPWIRGMRVSDLVKRAGGLAEGAYTPQANLLRLGPDQRRQIIAVNLDRAMTGDRAADVVVERGDILDVLLREYVTEPSQVRVTGLVNVPGDYPRLQGMRVSDAILSAGGLAGTAGDQIEYTPGGAVGRVQPIYLALRRDGDAFTVEPDPIIRDNDLVAVLGRGEFIAKPPEVTIRGRVARPGTYALQDSIEDPDTVYELIMRAGGLLEDANPNGIVLYRIREEIIAAEQEGDLEQVISTLNRELSSASIEGEQQRAAGTAGQLAQSLQMALFQGTTTVVVPPRRLSKEAWASAVPINGQRLIESQGREGDLPLMPGDTLIVPPTPTTMTVIGAVVRPGALSWQEGLRVVDYIQLAGGMTPDARKNRILIVRANGDVEPKALEASVRPGDVVVVPSDYLFREVNAPTGFQRILNTLTTILTGYLILK